MSKFNAPLISSTESAYMAGIIDGQGSLCICQSGKTKTGTLCWQVTCGITNTEERLIDWFISKIGGTKMAYTPNQTPKNSRKKVFRITFTGKRLQFLCNQILPFTVIKKRQVEIILEILNSFRKFHYEYGSRGPKIAEEIIEQRFKLMNELKSLHNRTGNSHK